MSSSTPIARPFRKEDVPRVVELLFSEFRYSEEKVTHLFENPDLTRWTSEELPTGFILEDRESVVGYIDSIPREVYLGQTQLKGAIRGSFYVREEYRDYLSILMFAMLDQQWCDLFMVNSSNEHSGPVNRALRFKEGPPSCAGVNYRAFSYAGLLLYGLRKSKRFSPLFFPIAATIGHLFGGVWSLKKRIFPDPLPKERSGLTPRRIENITDELFEPFWNELLVGNRGLLTSRRPELLRWTFQAGLDSGLKIMLGRFDGELLRGVITLRVHTTRDGFPRARVIDWIAVNNDKAVLGDLLRDAILYVWKEKCGILIQLSGFPESVQPLVREYFPRFRGKPNTFFYKTRNREVQTVFSESWFFGPYDGDTARY